MLTKLISKITNEQKDRAIKQTEKVTGSVGNFKRKTHSVDYFTVSFPYAFPFRKDDATTSARRGALSRRARCSGRRRRVRQRGDDFALSNRRVVSLGQPPQPLRRRARREHERGVVALDRRALRSRAGASLARREPVLRQLCARRGPQRPAPRGRLAATLRQPPPPRAAPAVLPRRLGANKRTWFPHGRPSAV